MISGRSSRIVAIALVAVGIAAYWPAFHAAFVYDDLWTILENASIRHLGSALSPLRDSALPVGGRPLVNFSLALNYAWNGLNPQGYHAVNIGAHLLSGLILFGIAKRTLEQPALRGRFGVHAMPIAAMISALWILHPLQTESVTYVAQRAESLMGLFYLLTLYSFIRAGDFKFSIWHGCAVLACLAGMAAKEVMVSAPVVILLYDRTFVAGSFRGAFQRRGWLYVALASTWTMLGFLVAQSGTRGGTAGLSSFSNSWSYLLVQGWAILHYLRLSVWPAPLIFDYGTDLPLAPSVALLCVGAMSLLIGLTFYALVRKPVIGFLGFCFFALLAPSSSLIPVSTEIVAEHRMYLPLAVVVALVVTTLYLFAGARATVLLSAAGAAALGTATFQRNTVYRSERVLWQDTVDKMPGNARAHFNLGVAYSGNGDTANAIAEYEESLRLRPRFASAHNNLSSALFAAGRLAEAEQHAREALALNPNLPEAQANLGNVAFARGAPAEAVPHYVAAVRLAPRNPDLHDNLAAALSQLGRLDEAVAEYTVALRLRPDHAESHLYLGNTYARLGRLPEAEAAYREALRLDPHLTRARENLGRVEALQSTSAAH